MFLDKKNTNPELKVRECFVGDQDIIRSRNIFPVPLPGLYLDCTWIVPRLYRVPFKCT